MDEQPKKYKTRAGELGAARLKAYNEKKKEMKEQNLVMTAPIARLDSGVLKTPKLTRGKKFSPQRLRNQINKYFEHCEATDTLPSMKGMVIFLKFSHVSFYNYMKHPDYSDILETARMHIVEWAERDVWASKGMAAGKIAYMKNVHGWAEKIDQSSTVMKVEMSAEQARAKIEALAPRLLEVLRNNHTLNQLAVADDAIFIEEKK